MAAVASCAAACFAQSAVAAVPRIVGGSPIGVAQAPWQAVLTINSTTLCGGVVIGARTVLTAAHCVTAEGTVTPVAPGNVVVVVGSADLTRTSPTQQTRSVSSLRVHPFYDPLHDEDDVAVLTLASPLDLSGAAVRAIPVVAANAYPPPGIAARVTGFGQSTTTGALDGLLRAAAATITASDDPDCSLSGDSAVQLCTTPSVSGACFGDSGGPLTTGSPAVLVGLVEGGISANCSVAGNRFSNLAAVELRAFIQGEGVIPRAPRGGSGSGAPQLSGAWTVGATLTCAPGIWTGSPSFTYTFTGGARAQTGASPRYALLAGDLGHQLACIVAARNAGGIAVARTLTTSPIAPAPPIRPAPIPRPAPSPRPPTVTIRSVHCRRQLCKVTFTVVDPASRSARTTAHAVARHTIRSCRRHRRSRRCRTRVLRQAMHISLARKPTAYIATRKRVHTGRVQFRVTATSTISGLRSKTAARWVIVRAR